MLMIFRENGDKFTVEATALPNEPEDFEGAERFALKIITVHRNDPRHGIQYKAGDEFPVLRTPNYPSGWSLEGVVGAGRDGA